LKPKATNVSSAVGSQAAVHSYTLAVTDASPTISITPQAPQGDTISSKSLPVLGHIFISFIKTLQNLVKDLPRSTPEASEFDRLAVFERNPKEFDDPALDADELWETTLNSVLKSMLGWGMEGNMDEIICHGKWGLDGLVNFTTYFVEECRVSGELFEGKLTHLVTVLKQR